MWYTEAPLSGQIAESGAEQEKSKVHERKERTCLPSSITILFFFLFLARYTNAINGHLIVVTILFGRTT